MNVFKVLRSHWMSPQKLLFILKVLAQCHVVLGIVMLLLASLADYISSRIKTIRLTGLEECCSFYFLVMGSGVLRVVGLSGASSSRRGLLIAFLLMAIHAILIFVPAIVITSSFDIHFYQHECFGQCDWHLLGTSLPSNSRCQILCGDNVNENQRSQMTRLGTDFRLDAGLITCASLELLISLLTGVVVSRLLCVSAYIPNTLQKSMEMQLINDRKEQHGST